MGKCTGWQGGNKPAPAEKAGGFVHTVCGQAGRLLHSVSWPEAKGLTAVQGAPRISAPGDWELQQAELESAGMYMCMCVQSAPIRIWGGIIDN